MIVNDSNTTGSWITIDASIGQAEEPDMNLGLKGKAVLITGGSKGIGKAIAKAFACEGARVAVNARDVADLKSAVDEIATSSGVKANGGEVIGVPGSVTSVEDIKRFTADAATHFGTIHVLVNNAGGVGKFASFDQLSDQDWLEILDLNVMSAVRVTREVLPHMQKQHWGRIINISSESATQPDAAMPHYNASKGALNTFSKSLSKAYAKDGILINTVSPAFIMTPLVEGILSAQAQQRGITPSEAEQIFLKDNRPHIELRRAGTSEEVAAAVVFLASEAASFITGSDVRVDGGSVASV